MDRVDSIKYSNGNYFKNNKIGKLIRRDNIFKHQIDQLDKMKYDGFIYVIGNFKYRFFKVGFSVDPYKRLKSIQTGCPFQVNVILVINANMSEEKKLHRRFKKDNSVGEWFIYRKGGVFGKWIDSKLNALNIQMGYKKEIQEKPENINELDQQFKNMFSKY